MGMSVCGHAMQVHRQALTTKTRPNSCNRPLTRPSVGSMPALPIASGAGSTTTTAAGMRARGLFDDHSYLLYFSSLMLGPTRILLPPFVTEDSLFCSRSLSCNLSRLWVTGKLMP